MNEGCKVLHHVQIKLLLFQLLPSVQIKGTMKKKASENAVSKLKSNRATPRKKKITNENKAIVL